MVCRNSRMEYKKLNRNKETKSVECVGESSTAAMSFSDEHNLYLKQLTAQRSFTVLCWCVQVLVRNSDTRATKQMLTGQRTTEETSQQKHVDSAIIRIMYKTYNALLC